MVITDSLAFEWDSAKNKRNRLKHDVTFEEAQSAFLDENGVLIHDPDHSDEEDRFLLLGMSAQLRLLVVNHTYRADDTIIRLISARKANSDEHRQYGRKLLS